MEPTSSLFSLSIDPVTKAHLADTARWAKFLAICGFILLAFMLVMGIFMLIGMSSEMSSSISQEYGSSNIFGTFGMGAFAFIYIISALIIFFPLLYLLRFANRMSASLNGNDQHALNYSFQNLKAYFRYLGIITIILLAFYAIGIIFAVIGTSMFS
ncbi:DUF5362 family protein [Chitinophagaceae bacterium LB-8]|jgi:hypothetical protein|uniref:DUF5362 family protein n=1 Tax=Paraflavisolibacter caeni TaxID=2982496 RepID=A0A9X3BHP3_9BACT|nr:DUF5362 family protein [Paraflavisolibacter caeni]MCU7548948.1 DUF5362 family protein [Paraflavisolibacter caeni]